MSVNSFTFCANCGASGDELICYGDCDAPAVIQSCELLVTRDSICGAVSLFGDCGGEYIFNMPFIFFTVCNLFLIKCLKESRILDIVYTTKCSSYDKTFLTLAKGFLDIISTGPIFAAGMCSIVGSRRSIHLESRPL